MPLPLIVSCFSKIQIGFAFLVPAHPGVPDKVPFKRVYKNGSSNENTEKNGKNILYM